MSAPVLKRRSENREHPGYVERLNLRPRPADPPILTDGTCACGCGKELPDFVIDHGDPFVSSRCARRFHGVVFASDEYLSGQLVYDETRKRWVKPDGPPANVSFVCQGCGREVEKYIQPSYLASGRQKALYCSKECSGVGKSADGIAQRRRIA